jgi:hypothetical protein
MQRVYGNVDDEIVHLIDADAAREGVTRSKWIGIAIETYLHRNDALQVQSDAPLGEDGAPLGEGTGEESTLEVNLRTALDEKSREIAHLKDIMQLKDNEIDYLRNISMTLTQKITPVLPPTQEEAKKKGWWQFWRRD